MTIDPKAVMYQDMLQTNLLTQEVLDMVLSLMGNTKETYDAVVSYYTDCQTLEDYINEQKNEL